MYCETRRQVIGVRETWLHPGIPAQSAAAVLTTQQPLNDATAEGQAATGRSTCPPGDQAASGRQPGEAAVDDSSLVESSATDLGQVEGQMRAATLADG